MSAKDSSGQLIAQELEALEFYFLNPTAISLSRFSQRKERLRLNG
jgi:hypothetical protein